jgi:hypothetical protein
MQEENKSLVVSKDECLNEISVKTQDILNLFKDQTLINPDDINALITAKEFAISAFVDSPQYRPMVVKLASVLSDGQFPTPDSKFWQCKAECEVHFNELIRNIFKIESTRIDIEEIIYKIKSMEDAIDASSISKEIGDVQLAKFDLKRLKLKKESLEFELKIIEKNTKYRIEEVSDWCTIANTLAPSCKHDLHNKQKSMTEFLFKKLEYEISKAPDEKTKKNLTDQLNTLKRLLFEKAKNQIS